MNEITVKDLLKEMIEAVNSTDGITPEMEKQFEKKVNELEQRAILKNMDLITSAYGIKFSDFSDSLNSYHTNLSTIRDLMLGAYFTGVKFCQVATDITPTDSNLEDALPILKGAIDKHKNTVLDLIAMNLQNAEMGPVANTSAS